MEDRAHSVQVHPHTRATTFRYFCTANLEQPLDVRPVDARPDGRGKDRLECAAMLGLHEYMVPLIDTMSSLTDADRIALLPPAASSQVR